MVDLFFCKQKTAYEMRISDWSSDVCSSDLAHSLHLDPEVEARAHRERFDRARHGAGGAAAEDQVDARARRDIGQRHRGRHLLRQRQRLGAADARSFEQARETVAIPQRRGEFRSEEHTSELQSLMRISYAVFCLKKKKRNDKNQTI